jgi:hypothetical protein
LRSSSVRSAAAPLWRALLPGAGAALALVTAGAAYARSDGVAYRRTSARVYNERIAEFETIMDRFYRGESMDEVRKKVNSLVDGYNKLVGASNREVAAAEKKLDEKLKPLRALEKDIDAMDGRLKRKPDRTDGDAVREYNALVDRRNAVVKRTNELGKRGEASIEAHNRYVRRVKAELKSREEKLEAQRSVLDARVDAYNSFQKSGNDLAFFAGLNRLYGRAWEQRRRSGASPELDRVLRKLRALRGELGAHAVARHQRDEHGLIVIEVALSGDEPCFFIVDTGAMRTTLAPGIVDALGLTGKLGDEIELVLAGGRKIKGREFVLPSVTVARRTEKDVAAAAVKVSEVGVDGLLGQSFLKRFIYTIDETKKQKLILKPRPGR